MENVSLPKDILDKLQSISHLEVLWKVKNYSYVQKGTLLGMVSYTICEIKEGLFSTHNKHIEKKHDFFSPADGYVLIHDVYNTAWDEKTPLFDLFNNNQLNDFKELNDSNGQLLLNFQNVKFLVDTNESSLKTIRTIIIF